MNSVLFFLPIKDDWTYPNEYWNRTFYELVPDEESDLDPGEWGYPVEQKLELRSGGFVRTKNLINLKIRRSL